MRILVQVAAAMQSALGSALDVLGRTSGLIRRQRKFSGSTLLQTLVLTVMKHPIPKTDHFVATAAQLGVVVTAEAIDKRFDDRLVGFLRQALAHTLGHALAADDAAIPLLNKFTAVEIADSTSITLPDEYAAEFPGCGGKAGSGQAAIKVQFAYNLNTQDVTRLDFQPGRDPDSKAEVLDGPVVPGSLSIRDLGYFGLARFRTLSDGGAYWISRLQPGTALFDAQGQRLDLIRYAQAPQGNGPIDLPVTLGSRERLSGRLIVLRVPPEVAARRRQKAYERAQKHGKVPSAETLAWCDWNVFVTNCPAELLSWKEVVILYRSRWQIEIVFKLWKSHSQLASVRENWTSVERMAMFWAKLIGLVLRHWLLLATAGSDPRRSHWKAAEVIQEWIPQLTEVLKDIKALEQVLRRMAAVVEPVAKKKRRKDSPSLFQLLWDPELLNWSC